MVQSVDLHDESVRFAVESSLNGADFKDALGDIIPEEYSQGDTLMQ